MKIRTPAVAGYFYPADKKQLEDQLDRFMPVMPGETPRDALAVMMPHAGYRYSGKTAAETAASVALPDTVVLLGPKHTRFGAGSAVSDCDIWRIPVADIPVNRPLAEALAHGGKLVFDDRAHESEHSLEVLLPFLWRRNPGLSVVPVALEFMHLSDIRRIAADIARVLSEWPAEVLLVASSDMSHGVSYEQADAQDHLAIDKMLQLNPEELYNTVMDNRITMCGVVPATCMLETVISRGAMSAELIDWRTSADETGDRTSVVGYAGVVIR